ncbi:MAG: hypothetical protein A2147_10100 [Chloroflexi bacterium RBG_16_57_8]|nr:MAG: hypothetical protein A2147_10100 [Chloroflexi bacterium RBG_16_57_8]
MLGFVFVYDINNVCTTETVIKAQHIKWLAVNWFPMTFFRVCIQGAANRVGSMRENKRVFGADAEARGHAEGVGRFRDSLGTAP